MASTPPIPQLTDGQAQPRSLAAAVSGTETTPDNPSKGTAEDRQKALQLTDDDKKNIMLIVSHYEELWSLPRRVVVRNTLRRYEYVKGNQYISFDPYNFSFFDPFDASVTGSQQGQDDAQAGSVYAYVTNVVQWLLRVFVASLGGTMPATRFSPADSASDLDNRTAENASRANALVERWNNAKKMLKQRLAYLGLSGVYFRHTRWVRDSRLCGTQREPRYKMEKVPVWPDHYQCPTCGETTEANAMLAMKGKQCQSCGGQLGSADFFPAYDMEMPVVDGYEEVAQGQVRQTVYSNLQVQIAPWDDEAGQDPLTNTPLLNLTVEIDQAALRAMYPDEWDVVAGSGESAGSPEGELDRMARLRAHIPGVTRGSALMTSAQLPTYKRSWIQTIAYNCLPKKEAADRMKQLFPTGFVVASTNGKFLDAKEASLTDEWTMCTTGIMPGPNPPAVLDPAMDFQDRINDVANSVQEYFDRLSSPGILYNAKMITKGLSGRFLPPGTFFPVPVNVAEGRSLKDAFFQPEFHIDTGWNNYLQLLLQYCQLLTGITPQMYGGHQQGIDTKGGQEQALQVATGINRLYWDQVREEDAQAAKLAVRCLADNATEDLFNVISGDTGPGSHKNDPIEVENLKGEFNAYPDEEQGYPISFEETREMLQQIIEASAKNPLVQELFQPMSNRRYFARFLAPGLEIPDQVPRFKVLKDISNLMQGTPMPGKDPATGMPTLLPSVLPDREFDDMEIAQEVVKEFAEKNYELAKDRPPQFMNLRLYYKLCARIAKEKEMEAAMPALPPGPPGAPAPAAAMQ